MASRRSVTSLGIGHIGPYTDEKGGFRMWVRGARGEGGVQGSSWDERAVGVPGAGLSRMSITDCTGDVLWAVPCRFTGSVQGPLQPQSRGLSSFRPGAFRESPRFGKTKALGMLGGGSQAGPRVSKLQPDHSQPSAALNIA
jgi:hypothetical protein